MKGRSTTATKIVDIALELANEKSWETVRLHDIAAKLNTTLQGIQKHFREKEDIADAWFERADSIMLKDAEKADFAKLSTELKLHRLIMTWLNSLSPYQRVTKEIVFGKLEPGHLHVTFPAILRVSRTVQWMREAAERKATNAARAVEETALTSVFLITATKWLYDKSENSQQTSEFLMSLLNYSKTASNYCEPKL